MASIDCVSFLSYMFDALPFWRTNMEILLPKEMEELKIVQAETARAVKTAEVRGAVRRTDQVRSWLEDVDALAADVPDQADGLRNSTLSGTDKRDLLGRIRELKSRRDSFTVLTLPSGMQEGFSAVKGHLKDDAVAIIGIHGLGGFGKSTLLQYLSNEFTGRRSAAAAVEGPVNLEAAATADEDPRPLVKLREALLSKVKNLLTKDGDRVVGVLGTSAGVGMTTFLRKIGDEFRTGESRFAFDKVVYATISRRESIRRLQQDLVAAMGLSIDVSSRQAKMDAAELIRAALSKKRVLLLLDDVRETLDLSSAGLLPLDEHHNYKSQIVFGTASPDVCEAMGAQATVKLGLLDTNQSWELFRGKAGGDAVFQDACVADLARQMARHCGGRPLLLVAVGRAMADKKLRIEWSNAAWALKKMTEEPTGHKGMPLETASLFSPLKFSYEYLTDDKLRACLLYCALLPEGHDIDREQLVEYWTGEGLLDFGEPASLFVARNRGQMVINSLQSACLLQSGSTDEERCVKLHKAVRDMALWITNGNSDGEHRFLVDEPEAQKWSSATRVSLMQEKVEALPDEIPICSELSTLLIHGRHIQQTPGPKLDECKISVITGSFRTFLPDSILQSFPALRVLDLSHTALDHLPPNVDLPRELKYLNLSHTGISFLPAKLGKLTKLRQLDLRHTHKLSTIPAEAIAGLKALQLLNMYDSGFQWLPSTNNPSKSVNVEDLEPCENLTELGVTLGDLVPFGNLQKSARLRRSVRFMKLSQMKGLVSNLLSSALSGWSRLRELKLEECPLLEELIIDNNQLHFLQVLQLEHLSRLSTVELGHCDPEIRGAHASTPLRRLSHLSITHCDMLKPLGWVGHLPRLEEIRVDNCKSMTQLLGAFSRGEGAELPRLRRLCLEDLSTLTDISVGTSLRMPSLEDIEVENCPNMPPASELKCRLLNSK